MNSHLSYLTISQYAQYQNTTNLSKAYVYWVIFRCTNITKTTKTMNSHHWEIISPRIPWNEKCLAMCRHKTLKSILRIVTCRTAIAKQIAVKNRMKSFGKTLLNLQPFKFYHHQGVWYTLVVHAFKSCFLLHILKSPLKSLKCKP